MCDACSRCQTGCDEVSVCESVFLFALVIEVGMVVAAVVAFVKHVFLVYAHVFLYIARLLH